MLDNCSCFCCQLLNFKINFVFKTLPECQTVWTQIRTDMLLVLIWVQTVCKGFQQTAKVTTSKERIKGCSFTLTFSWAWYCRDVVWKWIAIPAYTSKQTPPQLIVIFKQVAFNTKLNKNRKPSQVMLSIGGD